jgi:hypothetical protein
MGISPKSFITVEIRTTDGTSVSPSKIDSKQTSNLINKPVNASMKQFEILEKQVKKLTEEN